MQNTHPHSPPSPTPPSPTSMPNPKPSSPLQQHTWYSSYTYIQNTHPHSPPSLPLPLPPCPIPNPHHHRNNTPGTPLTHIYKTPTLTLLHPFPPSPCFPNPHVQSPTLTITATTHMVLLLHIYPKHPPSLYSIPPYLPSNHHAWSPTLITTTTIQHSHCYQQQQTTTIGKPCIATDWAALVHLPNIYSTLLLLLSLAPSLPTPLPPPPPPLPPPINPLQPSPPPWG